MYECLMSLRVQHKKLLQLKVLKTDTNLFTSLGEPTPIRQRKGRRDNGGGQEREERC